jgi:methylenetetrahydrofolate dehydrogenase (NADP+)/methenyltetrahydrofolate cyclohydrolase
MNILVDGKGIAQELAHTMREHVHATVPTLAVISVAPNFATLKYLAIKERYANEIGVRMVRTELADTATTEDVLAAIVRAKGCTGIVLQLPFPAHIDTARTLSALPAELDVDVIGTEASERYAQGDLSLLPPVVGAIAEIAERHQVRFLGAKVCVIGKGRLVGAPAALWATRQGGVVTNLGKDDELSRVVAEADIIILGAGVPGLLKPHMLRAGVAIFDAGTSEDGGRLAGDADPGCSEVAGLFTPVPGGIGPVAVAKLFQNLCNLTDRGR